MEFENKKLSVVSTPIGNLGDITFRAVESLKAADLILVEDTRVTSRLLKHYEISTSMKPFNAFSEGKGYPFVSSFLSRLFETAEHICLVSDGGTPLISDPGYQIIRFCREFNIDLEPIPGVTAAVTLLSVAGFPVNNFFFAGFLSNKKGKRKNQLAELIDKYKCTIIIYESPYRFKNLLEILCEFDENIRVAIGRELTKKFEEIEVFSAKEGRLKWTEREPKGEFVVLIDNSPVKKGKIS